jgi:hypothetical protein
MSDHEEKSKFSPRRLAKVFLTSSFLLVGSSGHAQTPPAHAPLTKQQQQMHDDYINQKLIENAKNNLSSILESLDTDMVRNVKLQESRFTRLMHMEPSRSSANNKVVIIDPIKFAIADAFESSPDENTQAVLDGSQVHAPQEYLETIGTGMRQVGLLNNEVPTYTSDPRTFTVNAAIGNEACIIVPASELDLLPMGAFTQLDKELFENNHEQWHCLHKKYDDIVTDNNALDSFDLSNPKVIPRLLRSPAALTLLSKMNARETFADLGGISEMLHQGYPVTIIDTLAAYRLERVKDYQNLDAHNTTAAMMAFKSAIAGMGIEKFKALDHQQQTDLIYSITDQFAFSPDRLKALYDPKQAQKDNNPELTTAKLMNSYTMAVKQSPEMNKINVQTDIASQDFTNWDDKGALVEQAYKLSGEVTPVTVVKAYAYMQDVLHKSMAEKPHDLSYPSMMLKLKGNLAEVVQDSDYVSINKLFGVDISKSKSLDQFPAPKTNKPTQPIT